MRHCAKIFPSDSRNQYRQDVDSDNEYNFLEALRHQSEYRFSLILDRPVPVQPLSELRQPH